MSARATAILPIKRFGVAKQRLGSGIEAERRRALVIAMLEDVLDAIGASRMIERTIVVSGERQVQEIARRAGAAVAEDPDDRGHVEAVSIGIDAARSEGVACVVLLPGDCPLLDPRELDRLLTAVPDPYVGVVPDRHGTGTNALVLRPPDAILPAFGPGSCERHVAAARAAGVPHAVEPLGSLALDLDTPADMVALTRRLDGGRGTARRTARVLGL